jgi:hypothetical protein
MENASSLSHIILDLQEVVDRIKVLQSRLAVTQRKMIKKELSEKEIDYEEFGPDIQDMLDSFEGH